MLNAKLNSLIPVGRRRLNYSEKTHRPNNSKTVLRIL